jgi:hypothetical protein
VDAYPAPYFRTLGIVVVIESIGRKLVAIAVERSDVMGVGGADNFFETVVI